MSVNTLLEMTSAAAGVVGPGQPTGRPSFTVSTITLPSALFQYSWLISDLKNGTACWNEPVMYAVNLSFDMMQPTSARASFCCLPSTGIAQFITKVSARFRPAGPRGIILIAVSFRSGCFVESSWNRMLAPFGVNAIFPAMNASLLPEPDHER